MGIHRTLATERFFTPFWSVSNHREFGEKADVFLDTSGYPRYHLADPMGQPWANLDAWSSNFGGIARMSFGDDWLLAVGAFRALDERVVVGRYTDLC